MQLVENEDMIGTLIDTHERIIAALETYDTVGQFSSLLRAALGLKVPRGSSQSPL